MRKAFRCVGHEGSDGPGYYSPTHACYLPGPSRVCCTPAGSITLRAKQADSAGKQCAGSPAGYDLSSDPGRDTVWEIETVNAGVGDLTRDAVFIYTTMFPGCKLYLTAPNEDGCADATVTLRPALPQYAHQQRWALAAVTGRPGIVSIVATVGGGQGGTGGFLFPGSSWWAALAHTHLPIHAPCLDCRRARLAPWPYWARGVTAALWPPTSSKVWPGVSTLQLAATP